MMVDMNQKQINLTYIFWASRNGLSKPDLLNVYFVSLSTGIPCGLISTTTTSFSYRTWSGLRKISEAIRDRPLSSPHEVLQSIRTFVWYSRYMIRAIIVFVRTLVTPKIPETSDYPGSDERGNVTEAQVCELSTNESTVKESRSHFETKMHKP